MNTLLAACTIAAKDLRAYFRDRVGMVLGFLLPIALISVFGYLMAVAFSGDRALPKATLWYVDEDDSPESRRFVSILRESEMVKVLPREGEAGQTADQLRVLVQNGDSPNALVIPQGYGQAVQEKKLPRLTLLRDPGRVMESKLISIALSQTVLAASSGELLPTAMGEAMRRNGMEDTQVNQLMDAAHSLELVLAAFARAKSGVPAGSEGSGEKGVPAKSVVAALSEAINQLIPIDPVDIQPPSRPRRLSFQLAQSVCGMVVMMLMFGMLSCSLTLLAERDSGTLRRLLTVPIPRNSIYWGKFLFVSIIGVTQLVVMFLYGNAVFSIGAFRDVFTLAVVSLTWTAAASAFGMLIATWARSTKQAEGLAAVLILLMSALGGCWFPIQTMDLSLAGEIITRSTLTYWAMSAYQGLFWNQLPWYDPKMLKCLGILWGFTAIASFVSLWLFRRRYMAG
jgi:ABC-2 type transport system permease protein